MNVDERCRKQMTEDKQRKDHDYDEMEKIKKRRMEGKEC